MIAKIVVTVEMDGKHYEQDLSEEAFVPGVLRAYRNGRDPANAVAQLAHLGWMLADETSPTFMNAIGN